MPINSSPGRYFHRSDPLFSVLEAGLSEQRLVTAPGGRADPPPLTEGSPRHLLPYRPAERGRCAPAPLCEKKEKFKQALSCAG